MMFFYAHAKFSNRKLKIIINEAARRLYNKLIYLDLNSVSISEYNKRYFGEKIKNPGIIISSLQCYTYILYGALSPLNKKLEDIVFIDYGGGHGMLALLAKELGIGTVIHNDIFETSCRDAKIIAGELNIEANYYVPGDIDEVILFLKKKSISCDAIANYDVIEHIYDIEYFLKQLKFLSNTKLSVYFGSGANELNPLIKRKLRKQHRKFELEDRPFKYGRKPTDETRALIKVRKDIISKMNYGLNNNELNLLADLTRGLVVNDIKQVVSRYVESGILPSKPTHPTNTCDPTTGNWFEHLMNPYFLSRVLNDNGFISGVGVGYYGTQRRKVKKIIGFVANFVIRILGKKGLFFSPFYTIYGTRQY